MSKQPISLIRTTGFLAGSVLASGFFLHGCASPLDRTAEDALREQIIASRQMYLQEHNHAIEDVTVTREPSDVEEQLTEERMAELDEMSGLDAYEAAVPNLGSDLLRKGDGQQDIILMTLSKAVSLAIENNLDAQVARLLPEIQLSQVEQAEADFDAVFFASGEYQDLDTPLPPGGFFGGGDEQSQDANVTAGFRQQFDYGTLVTVQSQFRYLETRPPNTGFDNYWTSNVLFNIQQPLLEGFGPDVNRAQVMLAKNSTLRDQEELRGVLLELVLRVNEGYWDLYAARQSLLIQEQLLSRTIEDRDRLEKRKEFDVSPVRITEANSFVELRRSEVIRARQRVRIASDFLKQLINSPDLPVITETLIVPADDPTLEPLTYNLLELVSTALRERPEMEQALIDIDSTEIRLDVADNQLLPELNAALSLRLNGLDEDNLGDSYQDILDLDYVDYIAGVEFEQALGNRGDEGFFRQRQLEREQALLSYRRQAQTVVLDVKNALRNIITSYELIGAARATRRAAADSLRAIQEQEDAGVALTPEFLLDLKLATQQRLADAEIQEVSAVADYNTAIAELFQATGTLLDRSGVDMEPMPDWPSRFWGFSD